MAIANGSITVGTVATLVTHAGVNPGEVHISNLDNVAVNSGHSLPKSATEDFTIYPGQSIYAVSSKAGHIVAFTLITP